MAAAGTLIGLFPELEAVGGVQGAGRHMAAVLAGVAQAKGWSYRFLSLNDPRGEHEERVGDRAFKFTGFARSKGRFVRAATASARDRPRFIFAAHPNLGPVGWLVKKLTGARMGVVGWGIELWKPLPRLRRSALRAADAVFAISNDTARRIAQVQKVAGSRVFLLPLAIEPELWKKAEAGCTGRRPAGFPNGRVLLSVTRLAASEGYKGVDTLIRVLPDIAARVPDVRYVVAGDGDDRPRLERLSRQVGAAGRVHFLGQVDSRSAELASCYSHCDVFVLPSKGEGFGLVFLEAMAFGKPVIGGAHGGTLDIIEDGVNGFLVPHGEAGRLTEVVVSLLSDEPWRRQIGEQARESVRSAYLFEHFQARLAQLVEPLCAS